MDEPDEIPLRHYGRETIKNILAGGLGTIVARGICQPLDVTKVRFQVYPMRYKSTTHALITMFKEEGLRGLWKGHLIAQTTGVIQGAMQFTLYEELNHSLKSTFIGSNTNFRNFLSGCIAGTLGVYILSPFELMKTRLMAQDRDTRLGAFKTIKQIFLKEGIRGTYKGAFTATLQVGPMIGLRFMTYNLFCNIAIGLMDKSKNITEKNQLPAPILLFSGGISGIVSYIFTYPIDVVKRRMQIHGFEGSLVSSCNQIVKCFTKTVQDEGMRGLYRGVQPTLIRSVITSSISFSIFDKIKGVLNRFDS